VPRRVNLPAADDLFRRTGDNPEARKVRAVPDAPEEPEATPAAPEKKGPSGRVKHDEKMTVYVTSDELLDLEHARLTLRKDQGLAVDRGRLVRVAISLALADYEEHGEASALVRRLTEE
jgi:hypothetical protein